MGLSSWIAENLLGGAIDKAVEQRLQAAAPAPVPATEQKLVAAASAGTDADLEWRRLSGNSNRLLPIAAWTRQVEVCYWLWKTNPLGNWIIETLTAFITGNGFSVTAKNEDLKAFIDGFWNDPINNFDLKLESKVRELGIFGVQCWPIFKAEQTGRVRMGMIDPAQIRNIYSDPENAELLIGVQMSQFHTGDSRYLKTVLSKEAETVLSPTAQQMRDSYVDGECFLFVINHVSNDPFGTSDIFVIADWLDEYEEFIYNYAGKAKKQNAFIWDVELNGADEKTCEAFAQKYPTQTDGAVRVHNEKATWTAVAPDLKSLEMTASVREFRNHILGTKNIPEHWFGGAGKVNLATAQESNGPIEAFVGKRQKYVKQMLKTMIDYAIESAVEAGYLTGIAEEDLHTYDIQVPEATNRDVTKIGAAVQQLTMAMVAAAAQGWLDQANAVKLFAFIFEMIGFSIDEDSILETDAGYRDYQGKGPSGPVIDQNATNTPERPNAPQGVPTPGVEGKETL